MRRHVKPRLPARVRRRALRGRRSRETTNTSGWHNPAACIRRSRGLHHARRRRAVANALTRSLLPILCAFAPPREYGFSVGSALRPRAFTGHVRVHAELAEQAERILIRT